MISPANLRKQQDAKSLTPENLICGARVQIHCTTFTFLCRGALNKVAKELPTQMQSFENSRPLEFSGFNELTTHEKNLAE